MNRLDFHLKKASNEKICMITCYDYTSAFLLSQTEVDCILVGDSAAMVMHGFKDTLSATLPMMRMHTAAVSRGASNKFIVSDMPFLSYRKSQTVSVNAALTLMQAGANAVKLEGALGNVKLIRHLVESGVPVMGHLGLTPQFVHQLGGYKVQGKTDSSAKQLQEQALALEEAGCFALVLECIPKLLAKTITQSLTIPTIGIGAGPHTSGQVLVYQDVLGLNVQFTPKFVKKFASLHIPHGQGVNAYIQAVKCGEFPQHEHCYHD